MVDNNSEDGSVAMVREKFPSVTLIASQANLGFAGGNNLGLKKARGKHILYLNPDIELIEDAIGPLYDYLENHPEVGVVGCKLLNSDRSHQSSIGQFTRLSNLFQEYYGRHSRSQHPLHPSKPTVVDFVLGACLLVRGDICREMGGFDERYFMYHDETDLCLTIQERGFQTVYFPGVSMIHHGSKSSTYSDESRQRTLHENRRSQYLFFQKHYSFWLSFAAKMTILLAMVMRIVTLTILQLRPHNRTKDRIKIRYYSKTARWLLSH